MANKCIDIVSFRKKIEEIHPNCFNTDDTVYINARTNLTVICKNCNNEFITLSGKLFKTHVTKCKICLDNEKKVKNIQSREINNIKCFNTESFKEKVENCYPGRFDTSNSHYINTWTEVHIFCKICNNSLKIKPYLFFKTHIECCKFCRQNNPNLRNSKYTIDDYINLANDRGWKYLSTDIPKLCSLPGGLFECEFGHQWTTSSFSGLKSGGECPKCLNCFPMTITDYKDICKNKGEFIDENIPKNTNIKCNWLCYSCNKTYITSYSNIKEGMWCLCIHKVNLDDYLNINISGVKYILNYIPKTAKTLIEGWLCELCNKIYSTSYNNLKYANCGMCHCTTNKTESKLYNFLLKYYKNTIQNYTPEWIRNPVTKKFLRFDFMLEINSNKMIIEMDGEDHFSNSRGEDKVCHVQKRYRDVYKMIMAMQQGFYFIRIPQQNVLKNDYSSLNLLLDTIDVISKIELENLNDIRYYIIDPTNIYDNHIEDLFNYYNDEEKYFKSLNTFEKWKEIKKNIKL